MYVCLVLTVFIVHYSIHLHRALYGSSNRIRQPCALQSKNSLKCVTSSADLKQILFSHWLMLESLLCLPVSPSPPGLGLYSISNWLLILESNLGKEIGRWDVLWHCTQSVGSKRRRDSKWFPGVCGYSFSLNLHYNGNKNISSIYLRNSICVFSHDFISTVLPQMFLQCFKSICSIIPSDCSWLTVVLEGCLTTIGVIMTTRSKTDTITK